MKREKTLDDALAERSEILIREEMDRIIEELDNGTMTVEKSKAADIAWNKKIKEELLKTAIAFDKNGE